MFRSETEDPLCPNCLLEEGVVESSDSVLPGTVLGHFEVKEKIGQGGMGEVYLARDTRLDRLVALKSLSFELQTDARARARFLREARTAAKLDHPFICKIHEMGEFDGDTVISMEYVEGETLEARIARGSIPVDEAVHIATEIADALSETHERGIVHRDLKPSNIMLTRGRHVKVMDLGLAKVTSAEEPLIPQASVSSLTASHTVVGSLPYLSPEQARGEEVDARSDIFSLGCVLYEMTTGRRPFDGATAALLFDQILNHDPVPPREHNSNISSGLDTISSKALQKDRDLRYQSVDELMGDLRRLDLGESDHKGNAGRRTAPKRYPSLTRPRIAAVAIVLILIVPFAYWNGLAPRRSPLKETRGVQDYALLNNSTTAEEASALAGLPTQNAEAYDFYLRGRAYGERAGRVPEDLKNARRMYEQAVLLEPQFAQARARLSIAALDPEEAKLALKQDRNLPEGHLAMAIWYIRYNESESALSELDLAEKGLPRNGVVPWMRSIVAQRQGAWEEVLRFMEEAVELEPRNPQYVFELGKSLRRHKRNREAIAQFDRSLELAPEFEEARYFKARTHWMGFGDPEPLKRYLSEVTLHQIKAAGNLRHSIRYWRWWVDYYSGNFQAALTGLAETDEQTFTTGHTLRKFQYDRWHLEGITLYKIGRMESARTALERARSEYEERLKNRPDDHTDTVLLGIVVAALGEKDRAIEIADRTLELNQNSKAKIFRAMPQWYLPLIYTLIGEYELAFDALDRMMILGNVYSVQYIRNDPDYAQLVRLPRWNDFEKKHTLEVAAR